VAFYQAEASMLNRENQMLRQRIRELERRISELTTSGARPEQSAPPATQGAETADHHASADVGSATEPTNKS
jgi:cell division septum initiation protein DivIVA